MSDLKMDERLRVAATIARSLGHDTITLTMNADAALQLARALRNMQAAESEMVRLRAQSDLNLRYHEWLADATSAVTWVSVQVYLAASVARILAGLWT